MQSDIVEKIKSFNINDIISHYLKLKKINHKQYKGNCPFHKDKTPSFFVDSDGFYKCFGCNKGGDVINFVEEVEKIPFQEAIDKICSILGIEREKTFVKNKNFEDLILLNNKLAKYFHDKLFLKENKEVLDYLIKIRKLSLDIIKKFQIGYCNDNFDAFLQDIKITEENLIKLSIIKKNQFGNNKLFFANRIIIPIFDKKNNVISFGGRIYKEENLSYKPMKYLNGSNNEIFHKSSILFNLNNVLNKKFEKKENNLDNPFVIVEGYMDSISLEKNNIKSVASLGTSLTNEQLKLIFHIDKSPYFCYDSDNAGKAATFNICKKIIEIIKIGDNPKFISLPSNCKDIDEFLNKFNKTDFKNLLSNAKDYIDYIFDYLAIRYNLNNPNEKSVFEKELIDLIAQIKDKILHKNYIYYIKNKLFNLKKKKTTLNVLNVKNKNIFLLKLASFLLQNPAYKQNEKLNEILQEDNQNFEIITNILNDDLSNENINQIKYKYIFNDNTDYTFNSIIDSIKLDNLSKKDSSKEKMINKIARKNILLKKFNSEEDLK